MREEQSVRFCRPPTCLSDCPLDGMSLQSSKHFRRTAIGVTVISLLLLSLRAALRVAEGGAADTYTNVKGMHITWGSVLVACVVLVVAVGAAFVARWWHKRGGWIWQGRFLRPRVTERDYRKSGAPGGTHSNQLLERSREP